MLVRHQMFQRILLEKEMPSAQRLAAQKIGLAIIRGHLLVVTGMTVAGVDERACVYYPHLQQVHVQGHGGFGHMLSKQEYRQQRARPVPPIVSPLFASAAEQAAYYRGAAT